MISLFRRAVPRTIFSQMVLMLAVAVVVAKVGSWYAYSDERAFVMRQIYVEDTIAKTAATVRLLADVPEALHGDVLEAASSREFRFWWDGKDLIGDRPVTAEALAARDRLKGQLGDLAREVKVLILRPNGGALPSAGGSEELKFKAAIRLADGRWLSAGTYQTNPPAGPTSSFYVSILSSIAIMALVAFFISRRISRPLRSIAEAAERLGRGETVELDEGRGPCEVRRAAAAFNAMGSRLRRFVDDRTRMLAAVSHDLRTPITNLRLRVELLEEGETKQRMLDNVDELRHTAEAMLAFAREEAGEEARPADLASLVGSVCDDLADLGAPVHFEESRKLPAVCRPAALRRVIRNLVENAVSYGMRARVAVALVGDELRVTIDDDGPGIADGDMERVFEPFIRLEASRNRRTGGVGLGLSIARSIARGHGGDITLENRSEGGLRAILSLPAVTVRADRSARRALARPLVKWVRPELRSADPRTTELRATDLKAMDLKDGRP